MVSYGVHQPLLVGYSHWPGANCKGEGEKRDAVAGWLGDDGNRDV